MAVLRHESSLRRATLRPEHLIGRSRRCDLRLGDAEVSSQHATLRWNGTLWMLRDLGSRNGTFLNGAPLAAGEHELTQGDRLAFGTSEDPWILETDAPPVPMAVSVTGDELVQAEEGLLALPTGEPEVQIFQDTEGAWVAEWLDGTEKPAEDLEIVTAGDVQWRLHLPAYSDSTLDARPRKPTLSEVQFEFHLSRDEEHVHLSVHWRDQKWDLGSRVYHYLLLTLFRNRERDDDASDSERGWVYQDELLRKTRLTEGRLSVYIFRARQQLAAVGVEGAQQLVERRKLTRQLRIGARHYKVIQA